MKIALLLVVVLVGLILVAGLVIYLIGRAQPERHSSSISFHLPRPCPVVWAALIDFSSLPQWWPAVKAIRFETRPDGTIITWNTDRRGRVIGFCTIEEKAPVHLVREITGGNLPFGGTWTYDLIPEEGGTRVNLTENGFVKPVFFRGLMKLVMKPAATMRDFERHFTAWLVKK